MSSKIILSGGNFQNPEGGELANGYLIMQLSQDAQANQNTQVSGKTKVLIQLDAAGNVITSPAQEVWGNDVLSPTGTYYTVWGYAADGQLAWGPNAVSVTSTNSDFDTGTWVPIATNVVPSNPPEVTVQQIVLETNGTPNASQNTLNLIAGANITLTDQVGGGVTIASTGGGGGSITLETNGEANSDQSLLNLTAGANVTLTAGSSGLVTIAATEPSLPVFKTNGSTNTDQSILNLTAGTNITLASDSSGDVTISAAEPNLPVFKTNGTSNSDQAVLNLTAGTNITLSSDSSGDVTINSTATGVTLETNGTANSSQTLLNLVAGSNMTLTASGGSVTFSAPASTVTSVTAPLSLSGGDLSMPSASTVQAGYLDAGSYAQFATAYTLALAALPTTGGTVSGNLTIGSGGELYVDGPLLGYGGALINGLTVQNGLLSTSALNATSSSGNVSAPQIELNGQYWNGTASASDAWSINPILGTGTNPTSTLEIYHAGATTGLASVVISSPTTVASLGLSDATTATTATAGSVPLPSDAVGFVEVNINGTVRKIPYYAL